MIGRTYTLRVVNKLQGSTGYFQITFDREDYDRPWWVHSQYDGAPLNMTVTADEFASIEVGDEMIVHLQHPVPFPSP